MGAKQRKLFGKDSSTEEAIAKTFNTTKKLLNEDVKKIQNWMATQPHLPEIMDDDTVKIFLINNDCQVELAQQKIDFFYTVVLGKRYLHLDNINPSSPHMQKIMDSIYCVPLPKLTKDLSRVSVWKVRNANFCDPKAALGQCINFMKIRLKEDFRLSETLIVDFGDTMWCKSTAAIVQMAVALSRIFLTYWKKTGNFYELFLKGVLYSRIDVVYVVNAPLFVNFIVVLVKRALKQKIYFCRKKDLKRIFSEAMLPVDYGGKEKSLEELNSLVKRKLSENQDFFDRLDSGIPGKTGRCSLGFYGSRKLNSSEV